MPWYLRSLGIALLSLGLCGTVGADGPKAAGKKPSDTETCGDYGTSVRFEKTPKDAAKKALKEEKLVMVLHISGIFENSDLT